MHSLRTHLSTCTGAGRGSAGRELRPDSGSGTGGYGTRAERRPDQSPARKFPPPRFPSGVGHLMKPYHAVQGALSCSTRGGTNAVPTLYELFSQTLRYCTRTPLALNMGTCGAGENYFGFCSAPYSTHQQCGGEEAGGEGRQEGEWACCPGTCVLGLWGARARLHSWPFTEAAGLHRPAQRPPGLGLSQILAAILSGPKQQHGRPGRIQTRVRGVHPMLHEDNWTTVQGKGRHAVQAGRRAVQVRGL